MARCYCKSHRGNERHIVSRERDTRAGNICLADKQGKNERGQVSTSSTQTRCSDMLTETTDVHLCAASCTRH